MLTLKLGSVTFTDLEVPEKLPFGVEQMLVVHKQVGGARVIDAMGVDYPPIDWSGWILGPNAEARAQSLVAIAASGLPQALTWSGLSFQVIVRSFLPVMENAYRIPYRINCEVIANNTLPVTTSATPSIDEAISVDAAAIAASAEALADAQLSIIVDQLIALTESIVSFALASPTDINGITPSVQAAQVRTAALLISTNASIGTPTSFGGVTPGAAQASANALSAATANTMTLWQLYMLQATLGRLMANLSAVTSSPNVVNTAGGNLFQIAQAQYGDATDWAAIAAANGLTDPFVQGVETLTIPPQPGSTGGILSS